MCNHVLPFEEVVRPDIALTPQISQIVTVLEKPSPMKSTLITPTGFTYICTYLFRLLKYNVDVTENTLSLTILDIMTLQLLQD